jgi:hypothetical protein
MDLQELKNKYPLLISYMKAQNYNRRYVRSVQMEIKWIRKMKSIMPSSAGHWGISPREPFINTWKPILFT